MTGEEAPAHRVIVLPWLKRPMQRLVLPNWTAITVGSRILAWRELSAVELAHELKHVEQWHRHGLRFIAMYLRASWVAAKAGGDRYWDNRFEKEAFAAAEKERSRQIG